MTTNEKDFLHFLKTREFSPELVGRYDVPKIPAVRFKNLEKQHLIGFNYCTNPKNMIDREDELVHFYLPDQYIEQVWNNPDYYSTILGQYKAIIQPDFSQYTTMPRAMRIWNYYRNMWLAAYFTSLGIRVIPSAQWSDEESFEYCFDGMPKNSCICVSTVGCIQSPRVRVLFNEGLSELIKRLEPSQLILYGVIDDDIKRRVDGIPYVHQESEMKVRIDKYKESLTKS